MHTRDTKNKGNKRTFNSINHNSHHSHHIYIYSNNMFTEKRSQEKGRKKKMKHRRIEEREGVY